MFKYLFFFIFVLVVPALANAHALEGKLQENSTAVVITFNYSTGEPAKFVEANVFSPENSDIEFQTGRTDMLGQVVFAPNVPGQWRVVVADTQGHKAEQIVQVDGQGQGALTVENLQDQQNGPSKTFKIVLGVSLILNISLLALLLFLRKKPRL